MLRQPPVAFYSILHRQPPAAFYSIFHRQPPAACYSILHMGSRLLPADSQSSEGARRLCPSRSAYKTAKRRLAAERAWTCLLVSRHGTNQEGEPKQARVAPHARRDTTRFKASLPRSLRLGTQTLDPQPSPGLSRARIFSIRERASTLNAPKHLRHKPYLPRPLPYSQCP